VIPLELQGMDLAKWLSLIATNSLTGWGLAHAQDRCPTVPFETDVRAIAATMAAEPLQPLAWYTDRAIANQFEVMDGARQSAGGGLGGHGAISMWYDAKNYVSVYLETQWPPPPEFAFPKSTAEPPPLMSNQLVRKISDHTYTLTVARPTPEEAREFACLANQLLVIPRPKPASAVELRPSRNPSREVTVTAIRPAARCEAWMTDGAYNNYNISTSRPGFVYDPDLSCDARRKLESDSQQPVYGPIIESFERRSGTWRPSRVRNLAVDAADNLYMLLDPGSKRQHHVEVRKLTPSGDASVLGANAFEPFDVGGILIDAAGHVLAIANETPGTVLFDLTSNTHFAVTGSFFGGLNSEVMDARRTLYATSMSAVYRLSLTDKATQLADLSGGEYDYVPGHYHLALAPDGRLLVSDSKLNIIETMTLEGALTVLAGVPGKAGSNDGAALRARFRAPRGLVVGRDGTVYVADSGNHTIRRIDPYGNVSTIAGKSGKRATVDGRRAAARLDSPDSIAIDSTGVLYVTNGSDNLIRKISPAGAVSTLQTQPAPQ
jgi:hypothetical protein